MRIVTGLQDTQYFEPETAMDWMEEDAPSGSTPTPTPTPTPTTAALLRAAANLATGTVSSPPVFDASGRAVDPDRSPPDMSALGSSLASLVAGFRSPPEPAAPRAAPAPPSDFEAAIAEARASTTGGIGWVPASVITDDNGTAFNVDREPMVYVHSDDTPSTLIGYDQNGAVCLRPDGQWLQFSADAFAAGFALRTARASFAAPTTPIDATAAFPVPPSPGTPAPTPPDAPGRASLPVVSRDIAPTAAATPTPALVVASTTSAPSTPAATYVGERSVDPAWLDHRQAALLAVRADYVAARARAESSPGTTVGWYATPTFLDDDRHVISGDGGSVVFIADPNAQPELIGRDDDGGPLYKPVGQWFEFSETAFAADYQAQAAARADTPLQALATLYGTDARHLLDLHPDVWGLVVADAVPAAADRAGSAPAGQAMGDPGLLGWLDLYLADPLIASLVDAWGGSPPPATGALAQEQVRLYGADRFSRLGRLANAMQSLRDQFEAAFDQARDAGGVGWIDVPRMAYSPQENGSFEWQPVMTWDDSGTRTPIVDRVFDPATFSAWYDSQPGLANRASAQLLGPAAGNLEHDETGRTYVYAHWFASDWDDSVQAIELNRPPGLFSDQAIGFDPLRGWVTPRNNVKDDDNDFVEQAFPVLVMAGFVWAIGPAANAMAASMGLTTTVVTGGVATTALTLGGVVTAGALAGGATSLAGGLLAGKLNLKSIVTGALSGALTAGMMDSLKAVGPALGTTVALRATVQGGIQWLLGGRFEAGALAGFASGLADLASTSLQGSIDEALIAGTMTPLEAASARMLARVISSAITAAGRPDDPGYAFANAFLSSLTQEDKPAAQRAPPTPLAQSAPPTPPTPPTPDGEAVQPPANAEAPSAAVEGARPPGSMPPGSTPPGSTPPPDEGDDADDRPPATPSQPGPAGNANPQSPVGTGSGGSTPATSATGGFTRNNGEHVDIAPGAITGTLKSDLTAPVVPEALLPRGVTADHVAAFIDDAGSRWYVVDTTGQPFNANVFTASAQQIVDQGPAGLESGAITPSQYLQAVRFIQGSGLELHGPVTSPEVGRSAVLQDQALRTELAQWNIQPIGDADSADGADRPLTATQATLLTQTGHLFGASDAERLAALRDSGRLLSLATVGASVPVTYGSLTAAAEGVAPTLGSAGNAIGRVLAATAEDIAPLVRIVGGVGSAGLVLLLVPGNTGQGGPVMLDEDQRFVTRPGDLRGNLEERGADGNWHVTKPDAILVNLGAERVVAVSDDELRQLTQPGITPGTPLPPASPPSNIPIPPQERPSPALPGPSTDPLPPDNVEIYPAEPAMTWEDLITESRSKQLGNDLRANGKTPPVDADGNEIPGYEAHHNVPDLAGGQEMADLRAKLRDLGVDLDGQINGTWLPGPKSPPDAPGAYHRTLNNQDYNTAILRALDGVNDRATAENVLKDISNDLMTGKFPGVRPRP